MPALVSIGIPITEGVDGLSRSIDSILEQTYGNFEVLIVDDSGNEDISDACRWEASRDPRLTYVNMPGRFGVLPSHAEALARSKGTYFMWLGIGDRLSPEFLAICIDRLDARSDLSAAIGRSRVGRGETEQQSSPLSISAGDPVRRVESLLEAEIGLDLWYGLFRRSVIAGIPFRNAIGFELAFLSEVAFAGKMESIDDAWCERCPSFAEETEGDVADTLGVPAFQCEDPHLVLAVQLFCNIAFLSQTFASLPQIERIRLAVRAYIQAAARWTINDESRFISYAVRVYPEARITDKMHGLRLFLARTLLSDTESRTLFEPLSRAEEIINGLSRMRIGRLPATQAEREIVKQLRTRFDKTKAPSFRNRAVLALALFV